ncbi:ParA family protein [Sulfurimonas sp. SAG-AH-194-C21]|nr:ParA family protein [Sulfurimonas sp. SAG-AH-194-C21]MDF1882611.1 ParA family protein [Sulfurimonas sp. SAG-AH-194-C21]
MYLTVISIKGGVGKTSIATNIALNNNYTLVTNDVVTDLSRLQTINTHLIDSKLKKIPSRYLKGDRDIVFDMGAMTGLVDPKVMHAIKLADGVIIPTLTDARSISATIETIQFVQQAEIENIFIIVNRVANEKEFLEVAAQLSSYIDECSIYMMKNTTLFKHIARDGSKWYQNIHHEKGNYMLQRTKNLHNEIYEEIIDLTEQIISLKGGI